MLAADNVGHILYSWLIHTRTVYGSLICFEFHLIECQFFLTFSQLYLKITLAPACNVDYLFLQDGVYVYVSNESREVTVINGAPPGYTSCDSVGRLPGCRFMFDEPDAQCSSGRSGGPSESPACNLSTSF